MNTIKVCRWEPFEAESDSWTAGCSTSEKPHEFVFNNGGPVENGFTHCPYCGRTIKEQKVRTKRRAVLDAIAALRTRAETAERERDEWRDATVRERIAADIKAAYQRGIGRSPRIVLRHAEAAHLKMKEGNRG